ncbi:MAG: T9SS type A sorting domain-containing protein [Lentimicrobium sp.]
MVYPNPASDRIFITTDRYRKFRLFNITGSIVADGLLKTNKQEIYIGNLIRGLYFLCLEDDRQEPSYTRLIIY